MSTKVNLMGGRWTYLGLIDDKVSDYPWGDSLNSAYLDAILRRSALFEEPILMNDGSLLHYEWARHELTNPESLLRRLISEGQVVIFSRREDGRLDRMVEDMSGSVKSYEILRSRKDWSEEQDGKRPMRELLEEVSTSRDYHYATWPDMKAFDNRRGFDSIINVLTGRAFADMELTSVSGRDFDEIVERYRRMRAEEEETEYGDPTKRSRGARTVWEETVKVFSGADQKRLTELMWLGNEVYHYNMALAVAGTTETRINVSTFVSNRMSSEFAAEAAPVKASCSLPHTVSSMPPGDFVNLVCDLSANRSTFRSSLRDHLRSPNEKGLDSALNDYADAIGEYCSRRFDQQTVNVPVGTAGVVLAAVGTALAAKGMMGIGSSTAVAGIAAFFTAGMLPHFVAAWYGRRVSRQFKRNLDLQNAQPKTGTFELDLARAKKHLDSSTAGGPA